MAVYFNTGYEEQFDFPERDCGPSLVYLIATTPRSGSTLLSHKLWETGQLGAPLEYLNFERGSHYGHLDGEVEGQIEQWQHVLKRRTSPNGVFGFKLFAMQLASLRRDNQALLMSLLPSRIIWLERADLNAQALSYARAYATGAWCAEQEREPSFEVEITDDEVQRAEQELRGQILAWEMIFDRLGTVPLVVGYEDLCDRPDLVVNKVAEFLEVSLADLPLLLVPRVSKQFRSTAGRSMER